MSVKPDSDAKLKLLVDHHRETFAHQKDYVARRDRLFLYAVVAVVAMAFRASFTSNSSLILKLAVEKLLGAGARLDEEFLTILLWFIYFAVVARYFQATITVERQYKYLNRVETEMAELHGSDLLSRESRAYSLNYPAFSRWMHLLYTWVFPIALLVVTGWNAAVEIGARGYASTTSWLVGLLALSTMATAALFVFSAKFQRGKRALAAQGKVVPLSEPERLPVGAIAETPAVEKVQAEPRQ